MVTSYKTLSFARPICTQSLHRSHKGSRNNFKKKMSSALNRFLYIFLFMARYNYRSRTFQSNTSTSFTDGDPSAGKLHSLCFRTTKLSYQLFPFYCVISYDIKIRYVGNKWVLHKRKVINNITLRRTGI